VAAAPAPLAYLLPTFLALAARARRAAVPTVLARHDHARVVPFLGFGGGTQCRHDTTS